MRVLIDDTGEHVLHPPQRVLKDGCCVFHFDYDGGWRRCTEGRWDGEDSGDMSLCNGTNRQFGGGSGEEEVGALVEVLPFIRVIMIVIQEFYLQSALHALSEPFIEALHVHFVALYVGEVPFVNEELADAAEFPVVVPEFSPAFYSVLSLCVNQPF
jgi:hypothetical protein